MDMIISNNYTYNSQNITTPKFFSLGKRTDNYGLSFCGVQKPDIIEPLFNNALSKLKKYTIDEYKNLTETEKINLRKAYRNEQLHPTNSGEAQDLDLSERLNKYNKIEIFHEYFTDDLKRNLDKKYGSGNYKLIIIGRSLSSLGKVLGYKIGEENIKNIPMSNAGIYQDNNHLNQLRHDGYIDKFRKYLNSLGLNKEDIQTSDKQIIITDYCRTGDSLNGAANIIMREDVLGKKNIIAENILNYIENKELKELANDKFFRCEYKDYSFVESTKWLEGLKYFETNPQEKSNMVRLLWFKLLDNEMLKQKSINV